MNNSNQELSNSIQKFKKLFRNEYKFLPVANEEDIIIFESKFNLKLPVEYRWFLLNIANGIISKKEWNFDLLYKTDFNNFWFDEKYDPSVCFKLDKKVIFHKPEVFNDYPYETYIYDDDKDKSDEEFHYLDDGFKSGIITLNGYGCGTSSFIVINGKEYGNVWVEDIASNDEVYPEFDIEKNKKRLNFIEWIITILNNQVKMHYINIESEKRLIEYKKESGEWNSIDQIKYLWNKLFN